MSRNDRDGPTSLAVKLMAVAAEHEMQVKREKQRMDARIAELTEANAEFEHRNRQQAFQIESLSRKLEEAVSEVQKYSASQVGCRSRPFPDTVAPPAAVAFE